MQWILAESKLQNTIFSQKVNERKSMKFQIYPTIILSRFLPTVFRVREDECKMDLKAWLEGVSLWKNLKYNQRRNIALKMWWSLSPCQRKMTKYGRVKQTFHWVGEDKNCLQLFLTEWAKSEKGDDIIIFHFVFTQQHLRLSGVLA